MIDKVEQSGSQRPRHRCYSPLSIISNAGLRPDFPAERPRKTVYRFSHDFIATEVFGKLGLPHSWVRIVHFPENPALKMSYGTNIVIFFYYPYFYYRTTRTPTQKVPSSGRKAVSRQTKRNFRPRPTEKKEE